MSADWHSNAGNENQAVAHVNKRLMSLSEHSVAIFVHLVISEASILTVEQQD